jgi:hypothetical protein
MTIFDAIDITPEKITIRLDFFIHKDFSVTGKELIIDLLSTHYINQEIVFVAFDGENLEFSGYIDFIKYLQNIFNIKEVRVESHGVINVPGIVHTQLRPGIFNSTGRTIPQITDSDLTDAKFLGLALGRMNPVRLRLAYEIDRAFPQDTFLILQPKINSFEYHYRTVRPFYEQEFQWLRSRTFDSDINSNSDHGTIMWQDACQQYPAIWNKFLLEIVSETDAHSSHWVTEKTARCLATGKPFVLMSGPGSLEYLKSLGFQTYENIIDESYDRELVPNNRIKKIINSLEDLKNNNFSDRMNEITKIALSNIQNYIELTSK